MTFCNEDCFNCPYEDCLKEITRYSLDIESFKKYEASDKGKERSMRYRKSEKGKENEKRKRKKKVESGKNAEYCRRYYQKHKEEILRKKREARERERETT